MERFGKLSGIISTLLIVILVLVGSIFGQNPVPTHVRSVGALPAVCNGGSVSLLTDEVVLITGGVGAHYICDSTNHWSAVAGSGSIGGSALLNTRVVGNGSTFVSQTDSVVDLRAMNVDCTGIVASDTQFATALTFGKHLLFPAGCIVKLASTPTIASNVTLDFKQGANLCPATSTTIDIQGVIRAGDMQIFCNIASGQGSLSFGGNRTLTKLSPLWFGIDCTNTTDNAPVWAQILAFTGDDTTFVVPNNCAQKVGSTISVSSRAGFKLVATDRTQNGGGNQRPSFTWTGSGGGLGNRVGMWDFVANQAPTVEGFWFTNTTAVDYFLRFDHDPATRINTEPSAGFSTFSNTVNNAGFIAIDVGDISAQNGEKGHFYDNDFFCSQTTATRININAGTDVVLTSGSNILTCSDCTFTTQTTPGQRIRVSYAPVPTVDGGIIDTTVQSITDDTHLVMAANATSNQTAARIHVGGALGVGIFIGSPNSKHHTIERDSFTQCQSGIYSRQGSFSAMHLGGSANDAMVTINNIAEPTELSYVEPENDMREVETIGALGAPLTLSQIRNSLSGASSWAGVLYFGNSATVTIRNSTNQLSLPANSVIIGKASTASAVNILSVGNQWSISGMSALGFNIWRTEIESNIIETETLISCGDSGVGDSPGACYQFGDAGTSALEGHLVVGSARFGNNASYNTYTAETIPSNSPFVNEAVSYKSNFGTPSEGFLNLSASAKLIGFDASMPTLLRGGNSVGFRFQMPTVASGTTQQPFSRGLWVQAPTANTFILNGYGVYVEDLATHTGITNRYSFFGAGTGDIAHFGGTVEIPSSGAANRAVCFKTDAKTLGFCSTVVAADGSCTCN